jgi:hypothetical protein
MKEALCLYQDMHNSKLTPSYICHTQSPRARLSNPSPKPAKPTQTTSITMPIRYIPEDPKLGSSPAINHFTACIETVINEGINIKSLMGEDDEEAAKDWLGIHGRHFDETLRRLNHSYHYDRQPAYVKDDEAEAEAEAKAGRDEAQDHPVLSSVRQAQPTHSQANPADSPAGGDETSSDPSRIPTPAEMDRDLKSLEAEFDQRINRMKATIDRLPQPPTAETLANGAMSLSVGLGELRECLQEMGVILSPEAAAMGSGR